MSSADLFEDGYPHGTVEGYNGGCRGGSCPAGVEHGLSCKRAKMLAAGDYRYPRLVQQGLTPAEIAAALAETPHVASPAPKKPEPTDDELDAAFAAKRHTPATTLATTEPEENVMPTPADVAAGKKRAADLVAEAIPTAPAAETTDRSKHAASLPTTEKWTAGLSQRAKTAKIKEIRGWCRANGFPGVPTHGMIPKEALAAYDAAHPDATTPDIQIPTERLTAYLNDRETPKVAPAAEVGAAGSPSTGEDIDAVAVEVALATGSQLGTFGNDFTDVLDEARERSIEEHVAVDDDERPRGLTTTPQVGMRAWLRYDDGVAVVRAVDGDNVIVSFLPDPRDEEAWESIDWLDTVTDPQPADKFSYDWFGSDDMAKDLDAWEKAGRAWRTPTHLPEPATATPEPDTTAPAVDTPAPAGDIERPEWADITIPKDIARARGWAMHYEQELADTVEQRDAAYRSLELVLRQWGELREQLDIADEIIRIQANTITNLEGTVRILDEIRNEDARTIAAHRERRNEVRTIVDEALAAQPAPWWKRIAG